MKMKSQDCSFPRVMIVLALWLAFLFVLGGVAHAQTVTPPPPVPPTNPPAVQQSVISWAAYVEELPVAPAAVLPANRQFSAYVINRGIGTAACNAVMSQLPTTVMTINKAVAPGITPTSWIDTTYPDTNGIVCWEVYVRYADGTFSLRSKRLIKEIISTKNSVSGVAVQ